jgi:hypothetical protein
MATLAEHLEHWLVASRPPDSPSPSGPHAHPAAEDVDAARRLLDAAGERVADLLGGAGAPLPLTITKGRAADTLACEGLAVARWPGGVAVEHEWAVLRGRALDALVAHVVAEGPVADAVSDAAAVWAARGDAATAEAIAAVDAEQGRDLAALAASVNGLALRPEWVPRVEVRMASEHGGLRVAGRVDLLLGGPGTGLPAVAVEVKSGAASGVHHAEAYHYALLCGLRHRTPPVAVALWYPDGTVVRLEVRGAAEASARRVADVGVRLAELFAGRPPTLSPGPACRWCPAAATCPQADPTGWGDGSP